MNMPSKRVLIGSAIAVVVLAVIAAVGFWMTNPQRTVDAFLKTVKSGDNAGSMAFVSSDTTEKKRDNIQWFVDDWTSGETFTWTHGKNESWRARDNGEDAKGVKRTTTLPTTKYLAHFHQAFVNATFDEFEDPVIIVLQRNTKNTSSFFSQIFRGWKVVQIKYQPLDESDFEDFGSDVEFDDSEEDPFADSVGDATNTNTSDGSTDETKPAENTNDNTNTNVGLVEPDDTNSAAE